MNIDSFHAYFKLEGLTADDINSIVLNFENGITTGITSPNDQTTNIPNNQWYTLDGRKLSGRPSAKGIDMNNGRKTVIR